MALIIVTGDIDSGKTTWCKEVLLKQNPGSDGILLIKRMTGNNFIGYDAFRILNGDTVPFARRVGLEPQDWQTEEKIGNFSISQKGKKTANRWIYEAASRNCIVIDEVGYLEVRGGGLYESVQYIINQVERKDIFLVVQLRCIDQVCSAFQIKNYRVLSASTIPHTKMSTLDRVREAYNP